MVYKNIAISVCIAVALLYTALENSFAVPAEIESSMKTQRMGGYIIFIDYKTYDKWTDGLIFKIVCKFKEKEFTFTSPSLNDIKKGWHKTEIEIPARIKERYGSLREYRIELYCKGMLIGIKCPFGAASCYW